MVIRMSLQNYMRLYIYIKHIKPNGSLKSHTEHDHIHMLIHIY